MTELNVSPFATNVLDLAGQTGLHTSSGSKVEVLRSGSGFVVKVDGKCAFSHDDNLTVSRFLNSLPLYKSHN